MRRSSSRRRARASTTRSTCSPSRPTPTSRTCSLQYRAEAAADIGTTARPGTDTTTPYEAVLDPAPLALGPYELRAVAADRGGARGSRPRDPDRRLRRRHARRCRRRSDRTRGRPRSRGLVDGERETDLAGYRVYRDGEVPPEDAITETAFTDEDVPSALHRYSVTAVDEDGNEGCARARRRARLPGGAAPAVSRHRRARGRLRRRRSRKRTRSCTSSAATSRSRRWRWRRRARSRCPG